MTVSKRIRIFTIEDVQAHKSTSSCWVSRNGKVYDVTKFLYDHPGGHELIMKHVGQNIEGVMEDKLEHEHSDSAYEMLEDFVIGRIGTEATVVSEDWVPTDDFHPDNTNEQEDFDKNQFLDLRKPLIRQVWEARFSKSYYLQQVHQPRHLSEPARFFGPSWMEIFTRTSWYVVPLVWLPISFYLLLRSMVQFSRPLPPFMVNPALPFTEPYMSAITPGAIVKGMLSFFLGNFIWTFIEYLFHRFLFHIDDLLPDRPLFLTLHFLLHGVHHYLPMDRMRLVMPPLLFGALEWPMTRLGYMLFPLPVANGIIAGAFTFYVLYDVMHYALHHSMLPSYIKEMKRYHLAHHYKNFELGFGVTSKIWDYAFNTVLTL